MLERRRFFRKKSLEICENLKKDHMSLTQYERQLCKRTSKFFKRAPISTIKMWRKRIVSAIKKNLGKEKVIGKNIKRFTQKNKQIRCRSDETRISLSKAAPLLRSSDSDRKMPSVSIGPEKTNIGNKIIVNTSSQSFKVICKNDSKNNNDLQQKGMENDQRSVNKCFLNQTHEKQSKQNKTKTQRLSRNYPPESFQSPYS